MLLLALSCLLQSGVMGLPASTTSDVTLSTAVSSVGYQVLPMTLSTGPSAQPAYTSNADWPTRMPSATEQPPSVTSNDLYPIVSAPPGTDLHDFEERCEVCKASTGVTSFL